MGEDFYPLGGMDDFIGFCRDQKHGIELIKEATKEVDLFGGWAQIVHAETFQVVVRGEFQNNWNTAMAPGKIWRWQNGLHN